MTEHQFKLIEQLLVNKPELITLKLKERSFDYVISVLALPEWKEERFKHLLTPVLWYANLKTIKTVFKMPEWEEAK